MGGKEENMEERKVKVKATNPASNFNFLENGTFLLVSTLIKFV